MVPDWKQINGVRIGYSREREGAVAAAPAWTNLPSIMLGHRALSTRMRSVLLHLCKGGKEASFSVLFELRGH